MSTAPTQIAPGSYCNHVAVHRALDAADLLREQKIGASGLGVLVAIARHCNQEDECWPSYTCITKEMILGRSTVSDALRDLIEVGAIQVARGGGRGSNHYHFTPEQIHARTVAVPIRTSSNQDCTSSNQDCTSSNQDCTSSNQDCTSSNQDCTSSNQDCTSSNQDCTRLVGNLEVVKETVKEGVKEEVKPTSQPAGTSGTVKFCGPPVTGKAKANEESLRTPEAKASTPPVSLRSPAVKATTQPVNPEMPTPVDTTPEDRLSDLYFTSLGEPRRHREAVKTTWPVTFRTLLETYTETKLTGAITWAFEDSFWAGKDFKLNHHACDPVDYFATKAATIVDQWEDSIRATKRKVPSSSAGPRNQPPVLDQDAQDMIRSIFNPDEI